MLEAIAWKWPGLEVGIKGDQIYANVKLHSLSVLEERLSDLSNYISNIQAAALAEERALTADEQIKINTLTIEQDQVNTDITNLTETLPTESEIDAAILEYDIYMANESMNKAKSDRIKYLRKKQSDRALVSEIAQINAATTQAEIDVVDIP